MKNQTQWNDRPSMRDHLPKGKRGTTQIEHFTLKEKDIFLDNLRFLRNGMRFMTAKPGKYVRLITDEGLQMSDTCMEWRTNVGFLRAAHGDVLIAGLGIGFVLVPLLKKPDVRSITVVEKNADVISLVAPHFENKKLTVKHGDINEYRDTINGTKFDTIYFDIWGTFQVDNLSQMTRLHRLYRRCLNPKNPNPFIGSWSREELRYIKQIGY